MYCFFRCRFQPEVVSGVISSIVDQDVGMDVCANFGDSSLKLSGGVIFGDEERRHSTFGLKIQLLVAAYYPHADGPHLTDSQ